MKALLTLVVLCFALTACGIDGAPVRPSEAVAAKAKQDGTPPPAKPVPNSQNPEKSFILDGLLD